MAVDNLDPAKPQSYIFGGDTGITYEGLQRRRAIAQALAGQKKPYPKTLGEGLTYFGEAMGDVINDRRLTQMEQAYRQQQLKAAGSAPVIGDVSNAVNTAPAAANAVTPPPTTAADGPTVPVTVPTTPTPEPRLNKMSEVGDAIGRYEPDETMRGYYAQLAGREDPTGGQRVSPTGAAGPFQFTRGTGKQYGLLGDDGTDNRTDVDASVQAVQKLTRDNAKTFIDINGRAPTLSELALMHQQGGVTGARMVAGIGNAPPRNLAVNNVDPSLGPQDAAAKIQSYYKMPNAQMPEDYHLGGASSGRDAVARAVTARGVPQANPTDVGPQQAPPLEAGTSAEGGRSPVQVASLDPSIGVNAVAPPEAASNPPITSDIQPVRVAQAGGAPAGIPGPLEPPTPLKPDPSVGRTPVPPGFGTPPVKPADPVPAPITPHEAWGHRQLMISDDPTIRDLAKEQIKFGQALRAQTDARRMDKYKAERALYDQQQTAWDTFARDTPTRELNLRKGESELADKQRQDELKNRLGGIDPKFFEAQLAESQKNVVGLPGATQALVNARRALIDQNAFTGSDAEIRLSTSKLLQAAGFPADPRVPATEQFRSFMAPVVAQMRQALVGGAQISNADIQMAEKAGGGQITLDRNSIKGIMDAIERINIATAVAHQNKLLTYAGNDPDRQRNIFGVIGVPMTTMEQIVPQAATQKLIEHKDDPNALVEFDKAFATPGLARRILLKRVQ